MYTGTAPAGRRPRSRCWTHWGLLPASWLAYETTEATNWKPGDRARVKLGTKEYSPGERMSSWVPGQVFTVSRVVDTNGREVVRGGMRCVLLKEANTWCATGWKRHSKEEQGPGST